MLKLFTVSNAKIHETELIQAIFFSPLVFTNLWFFVPNFIFLRKWRQLRSVTRTLWVKDFKAGKFSVEDDTHPGRPKTSVTKANMAAVKIVVEQDARLSVLLAYQKAVCKQFWKSVWTWERFALGGYLICSLRSKRHNALHVPRNF